MLVHSIFPSINGEITAAHQGSLSTFIRLAGCNLRCKLCDTVYAQESDSGHTRSIEEISNEIKKLKNINITITGGEPLSQQNELEKLCEVLDDEGFSVAIETNGSIKIPCWATVGCWVADWKTPSSGMRSYMKITNFENLTDLDFIKFIIETREDFDDALQAIKDLNNEIRTNFAFSPSWGRLKPGMLVKWMTNAGLGEIGAIMSWQIHKAIDVL